MNFPKLVVLLMVYLVMGVVLAVPMVLIGWAILDWTKDIIDHLKKVYRSGNNPDF